MNEQLAAIRARRAAVTPGEWTADGAITFSVWSSDATRIADCGYNDADAAFIAAAPADIDTLLAHVAALTAERDALAQQLQQAQAQLAAVQADLEMEREIAYEISMGDDL